MSRRYQRLYDIYQQMYRVLLHIREIPNYGIRGNLVLKMQHIEQQHRKHRLMKSMFRYYRDHTSFLGVARDYGHYQHCRLDKREM